MYAFYQNSKNSFQTETVNSTIHRDNIRNAQSVIDISHACIEIDTPRISHA